MKLNLHIISGEEFFSTWSSQLVDAANVRNLLAPQLVENLEQDFSSEFVYIVEAGQLERILKTNKRISVIYSGPLPEKLPKNWNVLYTTEPFSIPLLVNELTRTFMKYNQFESRLRQVIEESKPFSEFGPICFEMLNNPIIMVTPSFQILFTYCPKPDRSPMLSAHKYQEYYKKYNFTGEYVDMFEVNLLSFDQEFIDIAERDGLVLYSDRAGDEIPAFFLQRYY